MDTITLEALKKVFVNREELERKKSEKADLLSIIESLFREFDVQENPFTVSFTDIDRVVLLLMGKKRDPFLEEGLILKKEFVGNTAINLSMEYGHPVALKGEEHTAPGLKRWYCAAAPLKNLNGKIIGSIGISTTRENYPDYALGIVSSLAKAIENENNLRIALEEVEVSRKYLEIISEASKDGVLCLDANGKILYINEAGTKILKIDREKAIGKHVTDIVDFTPVILNVFKTHKGYVDKEFIIESPSRGLLHFIKTAVVVKDKDGNFSGVVDFFREINRVRNFVTSYIGAEAKFTFDDIIGENPRLKEAIKIAKIAARSNSSVLITGETGTGKEMFAQAIHFESDRSNGPFVAINCGAIPRDLAESEFFGYEPGAFTGASKKGRPGKFELADGGTLFLDEIEELPLSLQSKLLRTLQDKVVTRVGGTKSLKVDVRIITASNRDLVDLVNRGDFRKDLFYRLNIIHIEIPPLRERKDDIPLLVYHFIQKYNQSLGKKIKGADRSFLKPLMEYNFPGNVRELENIVERAVNIAETEMLNEKHLPSYIFSQSSEDTYRKSFEDIKKELLVETLKKTHFNISKTARQLGISRPTVYKLIKKYGLKG